MPHNIIKDENFQHLFTVEYDFDNKKRNNIKSDEEAIAFRKNTYDYLCEVLK